MWLLYAFGSAFFAGVTAILAKIGIRHTASNLATAVRTVVVLLMSCGMVLIVGSQESLAAIAPKTWLFLVLSGLATGASWLCYFRALQVGDVNRIVPIDKSSTVLTIVLAWLLLGEPVAWTGALGAAVILVGTYLMIERRQPSDRTASRRGIVPALFSALFASLTAILGKIGIDGVESNLGTAIRTAVVLVMAWLVVLVSGQIRETVAIPRRDLLFICLSGLATGASWLCYYRALQQGPAAVVVPIDKLGIVVTVVFSCVVLKDRLSGKAWLGLALIVAGTLAMLF